MCKLGRWLSERIQGALIGMLRLYVYTFVLVLGERKISGDERIGPRWRSVL